MFCRLKAIKYIKLVGNFQINANNFQIIEFSFSVTVIIFLLISSILNNNLAQDLFDSSKNQNFSFTESHINNIDIKSHTFDRLIRSVDYKYSLFKKQVFFDLQNYHKNEVVLYSLNDRLNLDVVSKDYSKTEYKQLEQESTENNTFQFDIKNYNFNLYFAHRESFFNNFIRNVERNQFFFDMYTKHNQIYTNEFSILDFQSVHANQYLGGTKVWGGIGVGMVGVLMLMPRSVTKWEEGYIDDAMANLNRAFTEPPIWDEDHWEINYIGHPYAGSLYYNTIRAQGGTVFHSFLFSAFISAGWEYVYEGVAEQPSIQDLFVTPVAGAILGELIHQATLGMKKNGFTIFEGAFVTIFNPMYVILNGYK